MKQPQSQKKPVPTPSPAPAPAPKRSGLRVFVNAAALFIVILVGALSTSRCASGIDPELVRNGCDTYRAVRPQVSEAHDWVADNWDRKIVLPSGQETPVIPERLKPGLVKINEQLPKLDLLGEAFCAAADAITLAGSRPHLTQDTVNTGLKVLMGAINIAVQVQERRAVIGN